MGNLDNELEPNKNRVKTELDQARDTLRNAAWLGTNEDRERIERAVELLCGEPCEDTISRKASIAALKKHFSDGDGIDTECGAYWHHGHVIEVLQGMPSVTPKQRTGHWIDNHNGTISCSYCHTWFYKDDGYSYMHYCPSCSAKMVEPQAEKE